MQDDHEEPQRYITQARDVLQELRRPSPYAVLDLSLATPTTEIHKAFMEALRRKTYTTSDKSQARRQLEDPQQRLLLDSQCIDSETWLRDLEQLRQFYARFDFLQGV